MSKDNSKKTQKDYEHLGRMLANIYETGYINQNQAYKMSFLKGVLSGLGGVIGATIVLAILLWVLAALSDVPLLERIIDPTLDAIKNGDR